MGIASHQAIKEVCRDFGKERRQWPKTAQHGTDHSLPGGASALRHRAGDQERNSDQQ